VKPCLLHLIRDSLGVFGDLGQADVTIDQFEAGANECRLKGAKSPQIFTKDHEGQVGLVAQDGYWDDLVAGIDGIGNGGPHGDRIRVAANLHKQVEYAKSI